MEKLRKCSICGGEPDLIVEPFAPYGIQDGNRVYFYQCSECGFKTAQKVTGKLATGKILTDEDARKGALTHWNEQITKEDLIEITNQEAREHYKRLIESEEGSEIAFDLGVTAGTKSSEVPDEADLMELLDKLSLDKMVMVIEYIQKLLIESAAEKVTACPSCGSGKLSKDNRFIVCNKCGSGGHFKVFDGGDVRLFWDKKGEPDHD